MKRKYKYLTDSAFLKIIDEQRIKEQFVKITVLDWNENPIQDIQGKVISGNLNLDASSSMRRTCNLTMYTEDTENDITSVNRLISINKKVNIEIGFINSTDYYTDYDIIWFPLGVYVIINPSISHSTSGTVISLQLKDKMCLLNGECGGVIPASVVFHEQEDVDENGNYVITQPTIYKIIQELVNHFGGEQLGKIIISDVDTRVKQVIKWTGSSPLYIYKTTQGGVTQYIPTMDEAKAVSEGNYDVYYSGRDVGYIYTDFTYPGELIADGGQSVCDILDKIKDTLGNYEYFYDLDGNFVFQEIKNYLNTSQAKIELDKINNDDYLVDMSKGKSVYSFDNSNLVTSYSNTPQYSMIKNDFIVWGVRETDTGIELPIRYHLSIDNKPKIGNSYQVFFYKDSDGNTKAKCPIVYNSIEDFPKVGAEEVFYMDKSTGKIYVWDSKEKTYISVNIGLETITTTDWRTELYLNGVIAEPFGSNSNYYYTELANEWEKLYDISKGEFKEEVLRDPSGIDFFLDFIDSSAAIGEFSVNNIGRRTKVINDDSINCVFEPEIPNLVMINLGADNVSELREECENRGQDYIQVPESIFSMTTQGGSFNSAYNMVRELLYQYTSYNESITIQSLPIYYLEPNTRITVRDIESNIFGDYMIQTISIPLDISSTMSITAIRALERF